MRKLKVKPEKVETTEDLEHFMKTYDKDGSEKRQFSIFLVKMERVKSHTRHGYMRSNA